SLWTDADRKRAAAVDAELETINRQRTAAIAGLVQAVLERELAAAPAELREKLRAARNAPPGRRTDEQKQLLRLYPRVNVTAGNVSLYDAKAHRAIVAEYAQRTQSAQAKQPAADFVQAMTEIPGTVPATYVFARGDPQQPRQAVEPG